MPTKSSSKKASASKKQVNSASDQERVQMKKYAITRKTHYTYQHGFFQYSSLDHAVAQAKRITLNNP